MNDELCHCGKPLHYLEQTDRAAVELLIATFGRTTRVTVLGGDTYLVPRHYLALHGLKADELGSLGFEKAS